MESFEEPLWLPTSSTKSWLSVLILSSIILATIWGISRLFGDTNALGRVASWNDPLPWVLCGLGLLVILTVMALTMLAAGKNGPTMRRQLLVLGPWALYLPTCAGSVPAVLGLVSAMITPFLGGGLIAVAAVLLDDVGVLPHDVGEWIARGVVTPRLGWTGYEESQLRIWMADGFVAVGLAMTLVGFWHILKAWREKRLETGGLYASVRHPQYLGIALWTFGLAVAVNSVAAYLTWFTVTLLCVVVAQREERRLMAVSPEYSAYRGNTPFLIPFLRAGLPLPRSDEGRVKAFAAYYLVGLVLICLLLWAIGVEIYHFL